MRSRIFCSLLIAVAIAGCAGLAEDVATHVVERDIKAIDQELSVFRADLALFRRCLKERGGSCQGSATTALPHSSQHAAGQAVTSTLPGSSQVLADSVAKLPAGNPARDAYAVLSDPVTRQAAALHNHLRGHSGSDAPGVSIESGKIAGGASTSTVKMDLKIDQNERFHHNLLASIGGTAWDSLHRHCRTLREHHPSDAELAADCRRATFIRGYLGAYFRQGEFLEVDVQLAGMVQKLDDEAAKIEAKIEALEGDVEGLEQKIGSDKQRAVGAISGDAGNVGSDVEKLIGDARSDLEKRFGSEVSEIFVSLASLATIARATAQQLADAAASQAETDVDRLAAAIDGVLDRIDAELGKLESKIGSVDQSLVDRIDDELQKADAKLSNVFKVSNVGFVSRDATFSARLPTIEVTLDPTAKRLLTVEDVDTGKILTGRSDFGDLGVVTDTSGVGVGDQIGAEILRVFLEALFDAHEGLPAVYPVNAPALEPTGLELGAYSLPTFKSPMGNVDTRDLTKMTTLNDRVATQTRVIVGRVIQGIGPFSLNNQALESFIVELVATSVRKAAEKATWCFYACDLDVDLDRLRADAEKAARDVEQAAGAKVRQEAEQAKTKAEAALRAAEEKMAARARQEAEQVKLRLQLSR